jgi:hypothetical protein
VNATNVGFALLGAISAQALSQPIALATDCSQVRIVSSFVDPAERVPAECLREAGLLVGRLVRYPRPASWRWVLVCDEAGWARFLRLSGRGGQGEIYASTDLESGTTYVRGSKLLNPDDLRASPDAVIAHELAHIQLHSRDEVAAEALGRSWLR